VEVRSGADPAEGGAIEPPPRFELGVEFAAGPRVEPRRFLVEEEEVPECAAVRVVARVDDWFDDDDAVAGLPLRTKPRASAKPVAAASETNRFAVLARFRPASTLVR